MDEFGTDDDYVQYIQYYCPDIMAAVATDTQEDDNIITSNDTYWVELCDNHSSNDVMSYSETVRIQRIYVPIIFGLTFIFGIIGNSLVVIVIAKQCSFKCVTNMYLLNLAVADLVFLAICVPFTAIVFIASWPFGEIMCKVTNYLTIVTMATSVMTLTAMSIDRYYAVLKPVDSKRYRTPQVTAILLVSIWLLNFGSLVPVLMFSKVIEYSTPTESVAMCLEMIPTRSLRYTYTIFVFLFYYALPLTVISLSYALMAQSLWASVSPSFLRDNMMKALNYRKKVAKMLLVIVSVFALCITPLHVIRIITEFTALPGTNVVIHIKVIAHCLAYMNSAMNPIIYAFMSQNFRKCFKEAFFSCRKFQLIQMRPFRDPEELPKSVTMGVRMHMVSNNSSGDQQKTEKSSVAI